MTKRHITLILMAMLSVFIFATQPLTADVDFGVSYSSDPYNTYYGDRITSEYRRGYQTDDWVERGESSVTESPIFSDGIRLTSWASLDRDDYNYGIASAIYYFDLPSSARSVRIKIHYDGESDNDYVNDEIAGRIWIKRTVIGDDYEQYYPSEGRYESIEKPLYGDTFVLPAKKRLEIIRISAREHMDKNGVMELHVVAEGRQRIDVKYIEVETYNYMPSVRVITRYYKDYSWRPWYNYTYWYFYTGPIFHFSDYYYVRYTYPYYHRNYIEIRRYYDDYLRIYYVSNPNRHYIRWSNVVYVHRRGESRNWQRERLVKWTPRHEEARKTYYNSISKSTRPAEIQRSREQVRNVLSDTTMRSPSAERARLSPSIQTRGSEVVEMKQRRDIEQRREIEQRTTPDTRIRASESRIIERTPTRTETSDATKGRREETRPTTEIRRSTSPTPERENVIKKTPQRSPSNEPQKPAPSEREEVRKRQEESRKTENIQRKDNSNTPAPKREAKVEENKKSNEEEEEEAKKKRQQQQQQNSNSSSSSDSSSRKKVRDR